MAACLARCARLTSHWALSAGSNAVTLLWELYQFFLQQLELPVIGGLSLVALEDSKEELPGCRA